MSLHYNIVGSSSVTTQLIAPNSEKGNIKSILITNIHNSANATVTLFIQDSPSGGSTSTYELLGSITIPFNAPLLLNEPSIFRFDNKYGVYITVGSSDTLDVLISQ